jgi:phosphoglycerate dehydrogenase-like enzyme
MSAGRLALLPKTAIVSNIARGAIFDEEALYLALKEERIGGAGIDVWWKYPSDDGPCLPSSFPFHELPNVVMTPHVGGSSDVSEEHRWQALADLVRGIADGSAKAASVEHGY